MKQYLILFYTWFVLISHSLSANSVTYDCSVATELPSIAFEKCQDYFVDRPSASSGGQPVKVTSCPVETTDPDDNAFFIYSDSPYWPYWLCRDKKAREGFEQPEAPALIVTIIADEQAVDSGEETPAVSGGGGYGGDFFDGRRPRRPGRGFVPFFLGVESANWLPAGMIGFAFAGLELPELPGDMPVYLQQNSYSDNSEVLVVMSEGQIKLYKRSSLFDDWQLIKQFGIKTATVAAEPSDFVVEDKVASALVAVYGWSGNNGIPVHQMPVDSGSGKAKVSGSASCGTKRSAAGDSGGIKKASGGGRQGAGGNNSGEGELIINLVNSSRLNLSDYWFKLGVALNLPLSSLLKVQGKNSFEQFNEMLKLAVTYGVLNLHNFLLAVLAVEHVNYFLQLINCLFKNGIIDDKAAQQLLSLKKSPVPYRFDDGRLTGFAILDFAEKYGMSINIFDWGKDKEAVEFSESMKYSFPGNSVINGVILYLLKVGETKVISPEDLRVLIFERISAIKSIRNYYSASAPTLKSSQRPAALPVPEIVTDISDIPATTQAEFLLTPPVIELLRENVAHTHSGSEAIVLQSVKDFFLALGLPVDWLPRLDYTRPSDRIKLTLELASEKGLLNYVNLITALKTIKQNRCATNFIELLVREEKIDEKYVKYHLETINEEEQPFTVIDRPTNYLLVFLNQHISRRQDFLIKQGLSQHEDIHHAWVELNQRQSLTWNVLKTALENTSHIGLVKIIDRRIEKNSDHRKSVAAPSLTPLQQTVEGNPSEDTSICPICSGSVFSSDCHYICTFCKNSICHDCGEEYRIFQGKPINCPLCRKGKLGRAR